MSCIVMPGKIVQILFVIYIINYRFEDLLLLEEILNFEIFDPLRIQVIPDDFCHSKFDPRLLSLLI
jgi:hypothetical protein